MINHLSNLFFIISILVSCKPNQTFLQNGYYKSIQTEIFEPTYSLVQIKNDSMYLMDFPWNRAGKINFSSGKYEATNHEIIFIISDYFSLSLNTGQVVSGQINCNKKRIFKIINRDQLQTRAPSWRISSPNQIDSIEYIYSKYDGSDKFFDWMKTVNLLDPRLQSRVKSCMTAN